MARGGHARFNSIQFNSVHGERQSCANVLSAPIPSTPNHSPSFPSGRCQGHRWADYGESPSVRAGGKGNFTGGCRAHDIAGFRGNAYGARLHSIRRHCAWECSHNLHADYSNRFAACRDRVHLWCIGISLQCLEALQATLIYVSAGVTDPKAPLQVDPSVFGAGHRDLVALVL
jgi:hypothetical protein